MRVFAVSDVHVDYDINAQWVENLSASDFQNDILILAGDISDSLSRLEACFSILARRFKKVLFVPGNHDLWVIRDRPAVTSLQKLDAVRVVAHDCGVSMSPLYIGKLTIIPLMSWYDYSFGMPSRELLDLWMDYRACRWPDNFEIRDVAAHFFSMNDNLCRNADETIISFSHFLPRIDLMPFYIPESARALYPVLGSTQLEKQIRLLGSDIHVYGHSHVNRRKKIDGILYLNNAFGYPRETMIAAKSLTCIYEVT